MWPFQGGGQGGHPHQPQFQPNYDGQLQIEGGHGAAGGQRAPMRPRQQGPGFGFGQERGQDMNAHGYNNQRAQTHHPDQSTRPNPGMQFGGNPRPQAGFGHSATGMQSQDPDRFSRPSGTSSQSSIQGQQLRHTSSLLGDIRLTTSASHFEPLPRPNMQERDFALAIATDYITAWTRYTQAGIARYLQMIETNHPCANEVAWDCIPKKRKYLETMLPKQYEEMKRQIRDGNEYQIRELVDWIRKEKVWEREHGFDDRLEDQAATIHHRHLLPWMQGAKVNGPEYCNTRDTLSSTQGAAEAWGSWRWGNLV
jgi:hypothetical protein